MLTLFDEVDYDIDVHKHKFGVDYIIGNDLVVPTALYNYAVILYLDRPLCFVCDFANCLQAVNYASSLIGYYKLQQEKVFISQGCSYILDLELACRSV